MLGTPMSFVRETKVYQVPFGRILIPSHMQDASVLNRQGQRYLAGGPVGSPFQRLLHGHVRPLPDGRLMLQSGAKRALIARAAGLLTVNVTLDGDEVEGADASLADHPMLAALI